MVLIFVVAAAEFVVAKTARTCASACSCVAFFLVHHLLREGAGLQGNRGGKTEGLLAERVTVVGVLGGPGAVLLYFFNIHVRVGHKLEELVAHVITLASQLSDVGVLANDPGVVEHLLNLYPFLLVFDQQLRDQILAIC